MEAAINSKFHGEDAVLLTCFPYQATVLPELGGNLISFRHIGENLTFIREPTAKEMPFYKNNPAQFGIPVLFPPNRIEDGIFQFGGISYRFPVNEPLNNNHIHGLFVQRPWSISDMGSNGREAFVSLCQEVREDHPAYSIFPHLFDLTIRYSLSANGLEQLVTIVNLGSKPMPVMLGFHTAFQIPFSPQDKEEDYKIKITLGKKWQVKERMLPSGILQDLDHEENMLRTDGINPFSKEWAHYFTALPQNGDNYMVITDTKRHIQLFYEVGLKYRNWTVWNGDAKEGFICAEPQTSAVNAANLPLSHDLSGLIELSPNETWSEKSKIYAIVNHPENLDHVG